MCIRDSARHAPNLASKRGMDRKPTAGIRLKVPPFLAATFKTIKRHGYTLRAKHGLKFKRHIKYDDEEMSLFLNV